MNKNTPFRSFLGLKLGPVEGEKSEQCHLQVKNSATNLKIKENMTKIKSSLSDEELHNIWVLNWTPDNPLPRRAIADTAAQVAIEDLRCPSYHWIDLRLKEIGHLAGNEEIEAVLHKFIHDLKDGKL